MKICRLKKEQIQRKLNLHKNCFKIYLLESIAPKKMTSNPIRQTNNPEKPKQDTEEPLGNTPTLQVQNEILAAGC